MIVRADQFEKMRCPLNGWQPCLGPSCGHFRQQDAASAYCGSGGAVTFTPPAADLRIARDTTKGSAPQKRR